MFAVLFGRPVILALFYKAWKEISRYLVCFIKPIFKIFSPILAFSLLFGVFFIPMQAKEAQAGFFSSFLGADAYAEADVPVPTDSSDNSQNMALLQANVSPMPIIQDKNDKEKKINDKTSQINQNASVSIIADNSLLSSTGPMGVSDGTDNILDSSSDQISVYVVRKGDSISKIAEMFDVSVNTILSANDMKKGEKLVAGDVLFILPISGVEHTIIKGQTLQSIAKLYKTDVGDIALYNGITEDAKLSVGDKLMIPGAEMIDEGGDKPAPNLSSSVAKDKNYYASHPIRSVVGYFVNPVPTGHKTQGLHGPGNRGIDIGAPKGTPIYAAAGGRVLIAKTGWSGGYGNMVIVEHSNGTKTLYAHMTKLGTRTGAQVDQGEIIGYVGSTGRSTGPHIHFEVYNAKNPGSDWSWKD